MQRSSVLIFIICLLYFCQVASGQDSPQVKSRYHVALFVPLYLDSAFDQDGNYRYGKSFPRYLNGGVEFYEGARMALDSLEEEGVQLDLQVLDTRSVSQGIAASEKNHKLDSVDLIIGEVSGAEARTLAGIAARRNIPFINVNYPNDAGVRNNPNYVVLNSTLYTHCAAIYKFIQKTYPLSDVIFFRKKGAQEDRLKNYFEEIAKSTASVPLKIKYVVLENTFTPVDLRKHLDNGANTVCIAGSLDLAFGQVLTQQLAGLLDNYPSVVFGMPNWWDATNFASPEYKDIEVIYTTPFYTAPQHPLLTSVQNAYKAIYYVKPTETAVKGFETVYHFCRLLSATGPNLGSSLSDDRFRIFTDFDIQPVLDAKTMTLNYFENKKIYMIKKVNGEVTAVF